MTGGKSNKQGTPQGGVISPLLANLYMNRFLKFWRMRECGAAFRAHLVNFADDFVTLNCGHDLAWMCARRPIRSAWAPRRRRPLGGCRSAQAVPGVVTRAGPHAAFSRKTLASAM